MTTDEYKAAADFWKTKERSEMLEEQLKPAVEEYLCSSSVCALATGTGDYVRCTPLGLAENNNVSLAVFEKNPDFGSLKSVQVMGIAGIIEPMSEEYLAHAEYKRVSVEVLQNLADRGQPMRLLCIEPVRMGVLFSDFRKQGYDSRQVLDFTQK